MLQSGLTRAGSALKGSCSRKTGEACCSEAESEGPPRIEAILFYRRMRATLIVTLGQ